MDYAPAGRMPDCAVGARLLSNGGYSVLITPAGTGRSSFREHLLTGWNADPTEDADGFFVYLRDPDSGRFWSLGRQPAGAGGDLYRSEAGPGWFSITRRDGDIEAKLEVAVAPGDDIEIRRVRLRNRGPTPRWIELTSYAEVVLNQPAAHAAHPAFSKLFVETDYAAEAGALLARRRPRSADEEHPWMVHALSGGGADSVETDRVRFLGRGRSAALPLALCGTAALSGATGSVLDPVFSLRRLVEIDAGGEAEVVLLLGVAPTRQAALDLAGRYAGRTAVAEAFAAAAAAERERAGRLALSEGRSAELQELAAAALYRAPGLGADPNAVGDPVGARAYWQALGVDVDLFLLAPEPGVVESDGEGGGTRFVPASEGTGPGRESVAAATPAPLLFDNGHGGFGADGREYVMRIDARSRPPMPWINVVANQRFGFLVSESGAATTWSGNSRQHRLTPWSNDPVSDPHGEALYLRDEEAGIFWSPLPGPVPDGGTYEIRHGFGYTTCRHASPGLEEDVSLFVPRSDPLKVMRLRLRNTGAGDRSLCAFFYGQLVLGVLPSESRRFVVTEFDPDCGALLARNPVDEEFGDAVAFAAPLAPVGAEVSFTGDRTAFLGRHGSPARPAALCGSSDLDGRTGAGLDPAAALQVRIVVPAGAVLEVSFLLGEAEDGDGLRALVAKYRRPGAVEESWQELHAFWDETVGAVQVKTPSPALDLMLNGWLVHQNLSCRLWGRSAFYQSGGAFGFRDQLQDAAALVYARPNLTRAQIVLHAGRQFVEGDVQHWWHPGAGRGTRTRFSDDLLWLPLVTSFYVGATGDLSVLDEPAPFLTARALAPGEDEAYLLPALAGETADVYAHCCRAIDRSLGLGAHGLPLMGTGDWNDGMNRVGRQGRGESVWLGFFLYFLLGEFVPICVRRADGARAERYEAHRANLLRALDEAGWDGRWYRRAYDDDGHVLGSAENDECRIDALAQAWAVISGAAPPEKARLAMDAVEERLVSRRAKLIGLLAPPFDRTPLDPGYIKGYVPGIRENGGQYTHAALWVVRAFAELGRRDRAAALLEMLTPVAHSLTPEDVAVYRVEPYVVAADVYGVAPHLGRGGWTWYTGSAGWMYRVALESVLGLRLEGGETLWLRPCVPDDWPGFRIGYRCPDARTRYRISVRNPGGPPEAVTAVMIDGIAGEIERGAACVPLLADGALHRVEVTLGRKPSGPA